MTSINDINDDIIKAKLNKYEMLNNELKKQLAEYKSLNIDDYNDTFNKIMIDTFEYAKNIQEDGEAADKKKADLYVKYATRPIDNEYLENVILYLKSLLK
jgi:hypothetical protein